MKFVLIYTTYKDRAEAEKICDHLLQKRLIACANFFPTTSHYQWKGSVETAEEMTAILKARRENWNAVKEYIESNHSYETPCIIRLAEVESNDSYASWVHEETQERS